MTNVVGVVGNPIILEDTYVREDGFYWVRIEKQDGSSKWIVALFENNEWSIPAVDAALRDEHFAEIQEIKIRSPEVDLHEEFEQIWIACGEGLNYPDRNEDGKYVNEKAADAYMWFSLGVKDQAD